MPDETSVVETKPSRAWETFSAGGHAEATAADKWVDAIFQADKSTCQLDTTVRHHDARTKKTEKPDKPKPLRKAFTFSWTEPWSEQVSLRRTLSLPRSTTPRAPDVYGEQTASALVFSTRDYGNLTYPAD